MEDEVPTSETQRGGVGNEIFDQVERLMAEEGLSRTNAFQRLSEMTGRRAGTVAANYYRVARQRGAPLQHRAPRGSRSGSGSGSSSRRQAPKRTAAAPSGDVDAALARAMDSLQELAGLVKSQQRELTELRAQTKVIDKMRSLVSEAG